MAGLSEETVLSPVNGHHRWSVRRGGETLVLHVGTERFRSGRARRAADARLTDLRTLGEARGLDPVIDGGFVDGELWWLTPAPPTIERHGAATRYTVDEVVRMAVDLSSGLARLHAAGLVSGQVTPEAVIPTPDGARLSVSPIPPEAPALVSGGPAPLHVPPEVLEGRPWTPAADIWGLASTLYTLLEGQAPHQREAAQGVPDLLLAVTLGNRPRFHRPEITEALRRVVERGLDPDPERRSTAKAFGSAVVSATGAPLANRLDTVTPGPGPATEFADDEQTTGRPLGSAYVLVEPIGRGGMGRVWRGVRRSDGSAVAVKVLRPELADDPDQVSRFLTERTALRSVVDPRVVRVHDLVVEGSVLAIVMDLVIGGDLRTLLREAERLAPGHAVELLAGVAAGLAAVHAAGIVHRDVKPENVLVPTEPEPGAPVKLTDFGIARIVDGASLTRPTQLVGTPDYVAPELAAGRQPSPAADVYALGILAYEIIAGRRPFVGPTPAAVLRAHLELAPTPPPGLDPTLWGIIDASLAKDPDARPTAEVLTGWLHNVAPLVADHPTLAPLAAPDDADPSGGWTPGPSGSPAMVSGANGAAAPGTVAPRIAPGAVATGTGQGSAPPGSTGTSGVPVMAPLVVPGQEDAGADDRLETRAGALLVEPPAPPEEKKKRWPIFTAVALAFLLLMGIGWFTARRDQGAKPDDGVISTTTAKPPDVRTLNLPFDELGRTEENTRIGLRLPANTLGGKRFAKTREVRVSVYPAGQSENNSRPVVQAKFDPASGKSTRGEVLTLDRLPEGKTDGVIDTLSVEATKGQCVLIEVPYEGEDLLPAEMGFDKPPTSCTEIKK